MVSKIVYEEMGKIDQKFMLKYGSPNVTHQAINEDKYVAYYQENILVDISFMLH